MDPEGDPKKVWASVKKHAGLTKADQTTMRIIGGEGEVITTPKLLAKTFNEFFIQIVILKIVEQCPPRPEKAMEYTREYIEGKQIKEWEFNVVNEEDVNKIICSLKNTQSTGTDGLSTPLLKKFRDSLVGPITYIVNKAIYSSTYPRLWKEGSITPLPKKGDLSNLKNWRPVTILNASSKILEKVMQS